MKEEKGGEEKRDGEVGDEGGEGRGREMERWGKEGRRGEGRRGRRGEGVAGLEERI